jgi:hypothetical protein
VAFAESVCPPRPKLTRSLVASYQVPPTLLSVRVGNDTWLDARDVTSDTGPLYVVTSDNPFSERYDEVANEERRVAFRASLARRGLEFSEAVGRDIYGTWPDEKGVALRGVSRDVARGVARGWDQFAFYEVDDEGVTVRAVASDKVLV